MDKLKVLGIGNFDKFCYITLKKEDNIFKLLDSSLYNSLGPILRNMSKGRHTPNIKISSLIDKHEAEEYKDSRIDIIYGKNKVFLFIHAPRRKIKIFLKDLEGLSEFVKAPANSKF